MDLFELLVAQFRFMPPWVRNVSYLVLLLVVVYLILGPRLITGQIVAMTEGGGLIPYRGVGVQTQVQGHILRFKSNEFGYWSIPVVNRLPGSVKLQIFHEDDRSWYPVEIDYLDIWRHDFRVVISNEAPLVRLETVDRRPWEQVGSKVLAALRQVFVRPAAARIVLKQAAKPHPVVWDPPAPPPLPPTSTPALPRLPATPQVVPPEPVPPHVVPPQTASEVPEPILNSVREFVAKVIGADVSEIAPDASFGAAGGLNYIQRIQVVESVEQKYGLKIPDQHWRSLSTIGELAEYLYDRKRLQEEFPDVERTRNPNDWYEIQQTVPEGLKPIFIPAK